MSGPNCRWFVAAMVLLVGGFETDAWGQGRMPAIPRPLFDPPPSPRGAAAANETEPDADGLVPRDNGWIDEQTLDSRELALRDKVRRVLAMYYPRTLNTRDHNPWELMHSIIAYGVHSQIRRGGPEGEPVNGISWLCYNGVCKGQQILTIERGHLAARKGHGVQGHYGQLLAILAQSRLPAEYPLRVEGRDFTLADLVESEKLVCEPKTELTFKLISLMHYLPSDAVWRSHTGQEWSIGRLIREELASPIRGAACGGTHRLMGLAYAVQKRKLRGEPIDGEFLRAEKYLNQYHRYTLGMQNDDGSFSTAWFVRREARPDIDRRLQTTGHILEWLVFSLSDDELQDPRVARAVDYLASILLAQPTRQWEIGPLGHALHGLVIYDQRRFGRPLNQTPIELVLQPPAATSRAPLPLASKPAIEPIGKPAVIEPPAAAVTPDKTPEQLGPSLGLPPAELNHDDLLDGPRLLEPADDKLPLPTSPPTPAKPTDAAKPPLIRIQLIVEEPAASSAQAPASSSTPATKADGWRRADQPPASKPAGSATSP